MVCFIDVYKNQGGSHEPPRWKNTLMLTMFTVSPAVIVLGSTSQEKEANGSQEEQA